MLSCPRCQSKQVIKNGRIHTGTPKYACKACGRQFVLASRQRFIDAHTRSLVDKLLLERVSLAGIVRITGVSLRWLQYYVNQRYATQASQVDVPIKKKTFDPPV
jgi:transposase-like protein